MTVERSPSVPTIGAPAAAPPSAIRRPRCCSPRPRLVRGRTPGRGSRRVRAADARRRAGPRRGWRERRRGSFALDQPDLGSGVRGLDRRAAHAPGPHRGLRRGPLERPRDGGRRDVVAGRDGAASAGVGRVVGSRRRGLGGHAEPADGPRLRHRRAPQRRAGPRRRLAGACGVGSRPRAAGIRVRSPREPLVGGRPARPGVGRRAAAARRRRAAGRRFDATVRSCRALGTTSTRLGCSTTPRRSSCRRRVR